MAQILVVEDDVIINQVVSEFLKEEGHVVVSVFDGKIALEEFAQKSFDLIILDIMIPSISGLEVLAEIRKHSTIPIIMLTAVSDEYTQLLSFNRQINDYVVKPFSPLILMKRVENVLRQQQLATEITMGDVVIQLEVSTAYYQGTEIALTKTEYAIFELLAKRKGKLVTREILMNTIWGYDELDSRVLDNHIKNLRKKVPSISIKTVIGRGYQLEETI